MCWMCLDRYTTRQLDFNMPKALKLQSEKKKIFFFKSASKKIHFKKGERSRAVLSTTSKKAGIN